MLCQCSNISLFNRMLELERCLKMKHFDIRDAQITVDNYQNHKELCPSVTCCFPNDRKMYICSISGSTSYLFYDLDKGSLSFSDLSFLICKMGINLMAESEDELKSLWMKVKKKSEKLA